MKTRTLLQELRRERSEESPQPHQQKCQVRADYQKKDNPLTEGREGELIGVRERRRRGGEGVEPTVNREKRAAQREDLNAIEDSTGVGPVAGRPEHKHQQKEDQHIRLEQTAPRREDCRNQDDCKFTEHDRALPEVGLRSESTVQEAIARSDVLSLEEVFGLVEQQESSERDSHCPEKNASHSSYPCHESVMTLTQRSPALLGEVSQKPAATVNGATEEGREDESRERRMDEEEEDERRGSNA